MLASTDDLLSVLNDEETVLIDARSYPDYAAGHIPGAVNLPLFSFHWTDSSSDGIESFAVQTARLLSMAGVDKDRRVVFYDETSGMLAARGVWLLAYLSHPDARMLDGGIRKWRLEGKPVETRSNAFRPSVFDAAPDSSLIAGFEYVLDRIGRVTMVDARSADEYHGTALRTARGGHIPLALNIDWRENLTKEGTFKGMEALSQVYRIDRSAEVITYCHGAYRAANSFLALRILGFERVRVYLGSWAEWGNMLNLPAC